MDTTVKKFEALEELLKGGNITPTIIYNEGWMLRLVLNWLSENRSIKHYLSFFENSNWFSEASLPTFFKAKFRGDKLSETYTHADGVYGNIQPYNGKDYIKLEKNCKQFVVVEAKMFSKYSEGISNAKSYNQVARTVACMCNLEKINKQNINDITFYTFLPEYQKENEKTFEKYINKDKINEEVKKRIERYRQEGRIEYKENLKWYEESFFPFLKKIRIELVSWESILELIKENDKGRTYEKLNLFYQKCYDNNKKK